MIYDLQKAGMWKRISAGLFDMIIWSIIVVGIVWILSGALGYDGYLSRVEAGYEKYGKEYGVDLQMSYEEFMALDEAGQKNYEAAYEALNRDADATYAFTMVVNLTLIGITLGCFLSYLILDFIVPLFLKNGQTLGKKIFGVAVMRVDGVKVTAPLMFIRTILGKFTLETMVPLFILMLIIFGGLGIFGTVIIGLILLVQIILMIKTDTNSMIHDVLAKTVAVDLASQMIFDSEEALIAYKEKVHAEQVKKQNY